MDTATLKKVLDLIERADTIIRNLDDYGEHHAILRELQAARTALTTEFGERLDSLPLVNAVCRELAALSFRRASLEYPGFISLPYGAVGDATLSWAIGNSNGFWSGDITWISESGAEADNQSGFALDAESAIWTDPNQIASAIWDAVINTEVERRHALRYPDGCPNSCEACVARLKGSRSVAPFADIPESPMRDRALDRWRQERGSSTVAALVFMIVASLFVVAALGIFVVAQQPRTVICESGTQTLVSAENEYPAWELECRAEDGSKTPVRVVVVD